MSLRLTIASLVFCVPAVAMAADYGRIVCASVATKVAGFELVKFWPKDKVYKGSVDNGGLRYSAAFNPVDRRLVIDVNKIDEFSELTSLIFSFEGRMYHGDFIHFKVPGEANLEIYCNGVN